MPTHLITSDILYDGSKALATPKKVDFEIHSEKENGDVSLVQCHQSKCILARHAVDLQLISLNIITEGDIMKLRTKIQEKFTIYQGFDVKSLDFSNELIVLSGCQLANISR